jgi:hypothetical protein
VFTSSGLGAVSSAPNRPSSGQDRSGAFDSSDEAAVAVHGRVDLQRAGDEERLPPARAVPDDADLAVGVVERVQVRRGGGDVADDLLVRHAALGPCRGRLVVRADALALPGEQVRADRGVAVRRELAGDLLGGLVVAGEVVDHHDPAPRPVAQRPRQVRLQLGALMSVDRDGACPHRVSHSAASFPARRAGRRSRPAANRSGAGTGPARRCRVARSAAMWITSSHIVFP